MIKKFKEFQLLKENPSFIRDEQGKRICDMDDYDSKPFYCEVNDTHTLLTKIYFGDFNSHIESGYKIENPSYPGRLWTKNKIISFWTYPNIDLFNSIIMGIERELKIKIFNNGWRIEVVKKDGEIVKTEFTDNTNSYYNVDVDFDVEELIPIEHYSGSDDVPEKEKLWHLQNSSEKEKTIKSGNRPEIYGGSYKNSWGTTNDIRWRQAKSSSESKKK